MCIIKWYTTDCTRQSSDHTCFLRILKVSIFINLTLCCRINPFICNMPGVSPGDSLEANSSSKSKQIVITQCLLAGGKSYFNGFFFPSSGQKSLLRSGSLETRAVWDHHDQVQFRVVGSLRFGKTAVKEMMNKLSWAFPQASPSRALDEIKWLPFPVWPYFSWNLLLWHILFFQVSKLRRETPVFSFHCRKQEESFVTGWEKFAET